MYTSHVRREKPLVFGIQFCQKENRNRSSPSCRERTPGVSFDTASVWRFLLLLLLLPLYHAHRRVCSKIPWNLRMFPCGWSGKGAKTTERNLSPVQDTGAKKKETLLEHIKKNPNDLKQYNVEKRQHSRHCPPPTELKAHGRRKFVCTGILHVYIDT